MTTTPSPSRPVPSEARMFEDRLASLRGQARDGAAMPLAVAVRPALLVLFFCVGSIVAASALGLLALRAFGELVDEDYLGLAVGFIGTAVIGLGAWYAGRPDAARLGGWGAAFGLSRVRPRHVGLGILAFLSFLVLNVLVSLAFNAIDPDASQEGSNVSTGEAVPLVVVLTIAVLGVFAPIAEEFAFRGVMLHSLAAKWGFLPAALATSLVFMSLHLLQVDSLIGMLVLGTNLFLLAMLASYLVRRTGSLVPGMVLHAMNNTYALAVSFLLASSAP